LATTVHHTLGRARTGDNPLYLIAACARCNYSLGDPGQSTEIKALTRW
jgi:hypothetical protein